MKIILRIALLLSLCLSQQLFAHNKLENTVPEGGAILHSAPEAVEIRYSDATWLIGVTLKDSHDQEIALDYTYPTQAAAVFSVPLPALEPGDYSFSWTVEGDDTHRLEGDISFSITAGE